MKWASSKQRKKVMATLNENKSSTNKYQERMNKNREYKDRKKIEEITTEFFKRRFPDKNIEQEKEYGYFQTWENRFASEHPDDYMDSQSQAVYEQMKKEGKC